MNDQMTFFDFTMPMVKIDKPIRLVELFSGYGSQAMALERLGVEFEHHRSVEFDKYAMASYNAVHGTDFEPMDICNVHGKDLGIGDSNYVTVMTYSFPCTDISLAGQRKGFEKGSGTRSSLLWEVERILEELKADGTMPSILLMENVDAIRNEQNKPHLQKWIAFLDGLGYTSYGDVLNAADYGIPQHRSRFFLLSILGEYNYKFPNTMDLTTCMEDYFEDLTDEQALKLVCKGQKAMDLMVELDEEDRLE